jgi:hypothetical protein
MDTTGLLPVVVILFVLIGLVFAFFMIMDKKPDFLALVGHSFFSLLGFVVAFFVIAGVVGLLVFGIRQL